MTSPDIIMDLEVVTSNPLVQMQVPDFDAYWERLHALGMPRWTAQQTAEMDRWLAGEEDAA